MSLPEIVQSDLDGEDVVARVDLGGEDELYVTPTRTLVYRAEGLLSDESVTEYPHGAERITVSEGRRKAKVTLDYGLDGERTLSLPTSRIDRALTPIVEGILRHNGVLTDGESVAQLFRFSELTIVVASERVVRHIGPGLWDQEFESYHYSDVTDLTFEDGSVNTSVVLTVDGQRERFKTPNEDARAVRSTLESTLLSYWDVDSIEEFRATAAPEEEDEDVEDADADEDVGFGDGPDPLFADPAEPEERPDNATRPADEGASDTEAVPEGQTPAGRGVTGSDASDPGVDDIAQATTEPPDTTSGDAAGTAESTDTGTKDTAAADAPRAERAEQAGAAAAGGATDEGDAAAEDSAAAAGGGADKGPTAGSSSGFEGSGFEAAAPATDEQILDELATLREVVERQNEELAAQRELIEQLIEELRRGR